MSEQTDIWVLGSGKSLDFVPEGFFDGRTVVATNSAADRLGIYDRAEVYTHSHYHSEAYAIVDKHPNAEVWAPEGDWGFAGKPERLHDRIHFYPHPKTRYDFDPSRASVKGGLIVSSTSLHGSMHLACQLGANNIFLVGADCGTLDGEANVQGYVSGDLVRENPGEMLARWNDHLIEVKRWLMERYPVSIMSLNPFVNFNLENHIWSGTRRTQ